MSPSVRRLRSERGAELIEMALVTPILLLLLGGIVDFGFMFRSWEVVTNAAREGARVGALPSPYTCTNDPNGVVKERVNAYLTAAGIDGAAVTVASEAAGVDTVYSVCRVTVNLPQPLPSLGVFSQFFGGNLPSIPLAAAATMRREAAAGP